jgi:hypothetical protein
VEGIIERFAITNLLCRLHTTIKGGWSNDLEGIRLALGNIGSRGYGYRISAQLVDVLKSEMPEIEFSYSLTLQSQRTSRDFAKEPFTAHSQDCHHRLYII